jgi:D-aminoacyl-tRNA deacylase
MKVALVNSRQDKAGVNIRHHIGQLLNAGEMETWQETGRTYEFHDVEERLIHAEEVDREIDADLMIFLSRHSSVHPVPVLTVHVTGNFGNAELGGTSRTLAPAATGMMQATLRALAKNCPEGYRVSYEVTHHGPTTLRLPSFFVEIGSTEKEWVDPAAGRAVAESVLSAVPANPVPLIGFGGTHYAARETEIALSSRGAFGHIAHTREIATIDEDMIRTMYRTSGAVAAYIDRKALDREGLFRITGMLEALGIPRLSESEILSMGHLSWDTYRGVREMAGQILAGARCFIHNLQGDGTLCSVRVDPGLLGETVKSDEPGLIKNLGSLPVVHLSTQDNRLLPEFITYERYSSELIHDLNTLCVKIIRNKEITATEKDHLIISRVRFDPHKARELGVPPGPYYKHLSAGQAIEINGRVIQPDMVSSCSETRIYIPGLENYP